MSAKSTAVNLLSRREHSTFEISKKLQKRDFSEAEIKLAISELKQGDWLSDSRFTQAYIRLRQHKGFGPIRIKQELNERGINSELIEQYLNEKASCWKKALVQQYKKKYPEQTVSDYKEKAKRIRFLQYRGFKLDEIYAIVK